MNEPGRAPRIIGLPDVASLERAAQARIVAAAARAIERRGMFLIVLAGGETPRGVYQRLPGMETDWSRWQVYFGDERCVPEDDPARNQRMAEDAWLMHVPIAPSQIHGFRGTSATSCAAAAQRMLSGLGEFDLVLLGLGEDGHTASLFPGHAWGEGPDAPDVLAVFDAPKPPRERVSLSAARLSRAREVLFLVHGEPKRGALARWQRGERLPANAIRPPQGVEVLVTEALLTGGGHE